jgi:hypothetical protein
MGWNLSDLSDKQRRLIPLEQRKSLGREAETFADAAVRAVARSEKELQRQIVNLLKLKGIEVNVSRMDKRKTDRVGWPDLTFSITGDLRGWEWGSESCAWEVKLPGENLTAEQEAMREKLTTSPNGWDYCIIHSVDEAIKVLKDMGID